MKNSQKRKNDAAEVLTHLKNTGVVSASSSVRQEIMYLIVPQTGLVSGGGRVPLINNTTEIIPGVSSFENKPLGKAVIVHGIRVRGNNAATSGESAVAPQDADFSTDTISVGLRNSDLLIVQGETLFKAPVRALKAQASATSNAGDEYEFDKPITFTPDEKVDFFIESPVGATAPTAGYLLLELNVSVVVEATSRDIAKGR